MTQKMIAVRSLSATSGRKADAVISPMSAALLMIPHSFTGTCMSSHKLSCDAGAAEGLFVRLRRCTALFKGGTAGPCCSSWKRQLPSRIQASALSGATCMTTPTRVNGTRSV